MNRVSILFLILPTLFCLLALVACNDDESGSGILVTQDRTTVPFDAIEVGTSYDVEIVYSDSTWVLLTADDNIINRLTTEVNSGRLLVKLGSGSLSNADISLEIGTPTIRAISASTNAKVSISGFDTLAQLALDLSTDARVDIVGAVDRLDVRCATSAELEGFDLKARVATVALSTSSRAAFTTNDSLSGSVSTSSRLSYRGQPIINVDVNTSGSLIDEN